MTLYEILIDISKKYARFYEYDERDNKVFYGSTGSLIFNLKKHSISSGKYFIVKNGNLVRKEIYLSDGSYYDLEKVVLIDEVLNVYEEIERLYELYYYSIPSRNDSGAKSNFKAINSQKITIEQMEKGIPRLIARYRLEGFILLCAICNYIRWKKPEYFFWSSNKQAGLILFRSWIINEEESNGEFNTRRNN